MPLNKKLKISFKKFGTLYHYARAGYSEDIFRDIIKISDIKKDSLILDIGCGTGKSIEPLAKKGYHLIGLDIGEELISIARKNLKRYKNVQFKADSFEKAKFNQNTFNLIICGQAFHWLSPDVAIKKSASILKSGGYLAVFSKFRQKNSKLPKEISRLFVKHCPNFPGDLNYLDYSNDIVDKIKKSKLFFDPLVKVHLSRHAYSMQKYLDLLMSYSWTGSLKENKKRKFLNEVKKFLSQSRWPKNFIYDNVLIIAKVKK